MKSKALENIFSKKYVNGQHNILFGIFLLRRSVLHEKRDPIKNDIWQRKTIKIPDKYNIFFCTFTERLNFYDNVWSYKSCLKVLKLYDHHFKVYPIIQKTYRLPRMVCCITLSFVIRYTR